MNFKNKSYNKSSWKDNGYGVIITLTIFLFIFTVTPGTPMFPAVYYGTNNRQFKR